MAAVFLALGRRREAFCRSRRVSQARLAWALAASALTHVWLAAGDVSNAPVPDQPLPAAGLTAWLEPVRATLTDAANTRQQAVAQPLPGQRLAARSGPGVPKRQPQAADSAAGIASTASPEAYAPLPVPQSDPAYYAAHELDVYPAPLSPLVFAYPERATREQARGRVSAMLLIDAAGAVNEVRVIASDPPGYFEEATRAVLAAARFSPARRNGQVVRSRLLISVDYDPDAVAGASR